MAKCEKCQSDAKTRVFWVVHWEGKAIPLEADLCFEHGLWWYDKCKPSCPEMRIWQMDESTNKLFTQYSYVCKGCGYDRGVLDNPSYSTRCPECGGQYRVEPIERQSKDPAEERA